MPNILITGNPVFVKHGVTFISYTIHMTIGVLLAFVETCAYIRWVYRDASKLRMKVPKEITELRREIGVWERTAFSLSTLSREQQVVKDTLLKKISILQVKLEKKESEKVVSTETYKHTLEELQESVMCKELLFMICVSF